MTISSTRPIEWRSEFIDGCAYVEAWRKVREADKERRAKALEVHQPRPGVSPGVLVLMGVMGAITAVAWVIL